MIAQHACKTCVMPRDMCISASNILVLVFGGRQSTYRAYRAKARAALGPESALRPLGASKAHSNCNERLHALLSASTTSWAPCKS